jgi:hypothetical protein
MSDFGTALIRLWPKGDEKIPWPNIGDSRFRHWHGPARAMAQRRRDGSGTFPAGMIAGALRRSPSAGFGYLMATTTLDAPAMSLNGSMIPRKRLLRSELARGCCRTLAKPACFMIAF